MNSDTEARILTKWEDLIPDGTEGSVQELKGQADGGYEDQSGFGNLIDERTAK